jgi:hypothetical protein
MAFLKDYKILIGHAWRCDTKLGSGPRLMK